MQRDVISVEITVEYAYQATGYVEKVWRATRITPKCWIPANRPE